MMILACVLTGILWAIARLHVMWGYGSSWPAASEADLARMVVGANGITKMPPRASCLAVAVLLTTLGFWPLWRMGVFGSLVPDGVGLSAGVVAAVVFALRGIAAYLPLWRNRLSEQPFATYDQRYYGPLCFALASGFAVLLMQGSL